jgi:outer membrane protein assembly factor BamB
MMRNNGWLSYEGRGPVLIGIVLLGAARAALAGDWPEFRGPGGAAVATVESVPTEWSTTKNIAWRHPIPGAGWSSPIIHRERIYLTTAARPSGGHHSLRALCLDTHTGKTIWDKEIFSTPGTGAHSKNSHASPTPITDGSGFMSTSAITAPPRWICGATSSGRTPP